MQDPGKVANINLEAWTDDCWSRLAHIQWRRFVLDIGGWSRVERRRRKDRGAKSAEGVGCDFQFLSWKRRVLVHSGCYFCSWIDWKLVRLLSGMHWLVSFGDMKDYMSSPFSEYWGTCPPHPPQSPPLRISLL